VLLKPILAAMHVTSAQNRITVDDAGSLPLLDHRHLMDAVAIQQ
jgi:hypothetical protein